MLYLSGLNPAKFWSDALEARVELQNVMASAANPITAIEKATGVDPTLAASAFSDAKLSRMSRKTSDTSLTPNLSDALTWAPPQPTPT